MVDYCIKHTKPRTDNLIKLLSIIPQAVVLGDGTHYDKVVNAYELPHGGEAWRVILEDDAVIPNDFQQRVVELLSEVSTSVVINFYASYQNQKKYAEWAKDKPYGSFYKSQYSGSVGVAYPTGLLPDIVKAFRAIRWQHTIRCDARIGTALRKLNIPVYYTHPSLVDHSDMVSLITEKRDPKRRAVHYIGDYDRKIQWEFYENIESSAETRQTG